MMSVTSGQGQEAVEEESFPLTLMRGMGFCKTEKRNTLSSTRTTTISTTSPKKQKKKDLVYDI